MNVTIPCVSFVDWQQDVNDMAEMLKQQKR